MSPEMFFCFNCSSINKIKSFKINKVNNKPRWITSSCKLLSICRDSCYVLGVYGWFQRPSCTICFFSIVNTIGHIFILGKETACIKNYKERWSKWWSPERKELKGKNKEIEVAFLIIFVILCCTYCKLMFYLFCFYMSTIIKYWSIWNIYAACCK